jgi:hypothetical protein
MPHTVISLKTVTVQFCVYSYLVSEKADTGNEMNDYNLALSSLTLELDTCFIHFIGGGVIKGRFMDAVGNILIVPLLGIVPHSPNC